MAWIDLLYASMAGFLCLLALSILMIAPPVPVKSGVETKAEFLVKMTWPTGSYDDVDMHLLLPSGGHLHFRNKELEFAMIDHDDLGTNGMWVTNGKANKVSGHEEVITLRALVPGTYAVNVHIFRVNGTPDNETPVALPYPVKVTLTKLNPRVVELAAVEVEMHEVGEQRTAFSFTVLDTGEAKVDTAADVPFIPLKQFTTDR